MTLWTGSSEDALERQTSEFQDFSDDIVLRDYEHFASFAHRGCLVCGSSNQRSERVR